MEDSMFDEQCVTTGEEIKEAREALVKLGLEIARRGMDAEFNEAQIVYANANARMELAPPLTGKPLRRLKPRTAGSSPCSRKAGKRATSCCSTATGSTRSASATITGRKANRARQTTADRDDWQSLCRDLWYATLPDLRWRVHPDTGCESCDDPLLFTGGVILLWRSHSSCSSFIGTPVLFL